MAGRTFRFLRISRIFFKIIGLVLTGLLVAAGVVMLVGKGRPDAPRVMGLGVLLNAVLVFFLTFTISSGITLLLKVAEKVGVLSDQEQAPPT